MSNYKFITSIKFSIKKTHLLSELEENARRNIAKANCLEHRFDKIHENITESLKVSTHAFKFLLLLLFEISID